MLKLLLFGLLFFVLYSMLRGKTSVRKAPGTRTRPVEHMVVCARCGVHVPENESVTSGQLHYCCEQHRGLDASDRDA